MTPLLPTIGQDFGEVGQKSSDAALSNLLLEYHQKLHPVILTSPRPCLFLFLRHQNVSLNYRSGCGPPLSLFSSSIRRETTFATSTDINSSSEQTLSSNKIFIRTLRLIAKPLWNLDKGLRGQVQKQIFIVVEGSWAVCLHLGETLFRRNCSCSQTLANIARASDPSGNIYGYKVAL